MSKAEKTLLAMALALSVGTVYAQDSGGNGGDGGGGGGHTATTETFQEWVNSHTGRNAPADYATDTPRRWEARDQTQPGVTPELVDAARWPQNTRNRSRDERTARESRH